MVEQLDLPFSYPPLPVRPHPGRVDPKVWVARVVLLRRRDTTKRALIRDIPLRRGLNILWAPDKSNTGASSAGSRLTGHSAGKTTFCRLIRYLLGEERFGTSRTQERIRSRLPDGWVIGQVFVQGESWIVGRPFGRGRHPFAVRGASWEEALHNGDPYQHFLSALEATTEAVPVRRLPYAERPVDWSLLLTWLTRDQEARFSRIDRFRDPSSGSRSPSLTVGDRQIFLQAILGLISDADSALKERVENLRHERRKLEAYGVGLSARAVEDRRRLADLMGSSAAMNDNGPPHTAEWLEARRSSLEGLERAVAEMTAQVAPLWESWRQVSEEVGACVQRLKAAQEKLNLAKAKVADLAAIAEDEAAAELVAPRSAAPGFCNVRLSVAREGGCKLAMQAAAVLGEAKAHRDMEAEAGRLSRELEAATREVAEGEVALARARARQTREASAYKDRGAQIDTMRRRTIEDRAALAELTRLEKYVADAKQSLQANTSHLGELSEELQRISDERVARRREQDEARARLQKRFCHIVRELLGDSFDGEVDTPGEYLDLHIRQRGERTGAAMDTVTLLAFDLAALTFGIEGHGCFPGFLIHDGPREADLGLSIYQQIFRYAVRLEQAFHVGAEPGFQYIVTTTAPPPPELARAPWLIEPPLDASVREGRLLKEDL